MAALLDNQLCFAQLSPPTLQVIVISYNATQTISRPSVLETCLPERLISESPRAPELNPGPLALRASELPLSHRDRVTRHTAAVKFSLTCK